ncbi:MAG: TetR family transcriptional regulator [Actinomycetota bacterium]|nr:TetR family transcriptional regulator [Actinomycetota bacterium]
MAKDLAATRRQTIHDAAIAEFSDRGFSATSMANIALAADMSRPALYQYFKNKTDIFASAFVSLINDHVEAAIGALAGPGSVAERLDSFLQRYDGDMWQRLRASAHSDEILEVKNDEVMKQVHAAMSRLRDGLATYLRDVSAAGVDDAKLTGWVDVVQLSPKGFKADRPPVSVFRRRLTVLADSVAADIAAGH